MFLTKKLQNSSFKEVISLENTFPDSFTGNGLTDIFLPDFDNQRITVLMNLNLELLNSIRKNISGSFPAGSIRYTNTLIFPEITYLDENIIFKITQESFLKNYNVDDPTDENIIRNNNIEIVNDAPEEASEINVLVSAVFKSVDEDGSGEIDLSKSIVMVPVDNKNFYLTETKPLVGDIISPLRINNYTNTISLFSNANKNKKLLKTADFGKLVYIKSNEVANSDNYGYSVAKFENFVAVGIPRKEFVDEDGNVISNVGAVSLINLETKTEEIIFPSNKSAASAFGTSIDMNDKYIVTGAPTSNGADGSVFIYKLDTKEKITLVPTDIIVDNQFGYDVKLSDNILIVGAPAKNNKVYLYDLTSPDNNYNEVIITPSDGLTTGWFGCSVDVYENMVLIGAYRSEGDYGSMYLYDLSNSDDNYQEIQIKASDGENDDYFGRHVCINSKYVIGSAYGADEISSATGSVYGYDRTNDLKEFKILPENIGEYGSDYFGSSLSLNKFNNKLAIGTKLSDLSGYTDNGDVYIFDLDSDSETNYNQLYIKPPIKESTIYFGSALSFYKNELAIGEYCNNDIENDSGAIYIYKDN